MSTAHTVTVHKRNTRGKDPLISIVLIDWSVRERFHALDWLNAQDVPRDEYELVWVELFDRVIPEVMEKADAVLTCGQRGIYSKHQGWNIGNLHTRGQIVTNCDSDAVFPPDFIASIKRKFAGDRPDELNPLVLMHDEFRNNEVTYPDGISTIEQVRAYHWMPLWKNFGACMSFRRIDTIRFGGWDEHPRFLGFHAGADLPWRLINAGLPQIWHDDSVALYHFAHPHPEAAYKLFSFDRKMWQELRAPTVHGAPMAAVESFATGRILPLHENPDIHATRLALRRIDSEGETMIGNTPISISGFTRKERLRLYLKFYRYKLAVSLKHSRWWPRRRRSAA